MVDASFIELIIYAFVEMFSISMLIISAVKEVPNTRASSIVRSIYLIPGMIAAGVMSGIGENITLPEVTTKSLNTTEVWVETAQVHLLNPYWGMFHLMIMLVLMIYVAFQMLNLLTKPE